ncbi:MAG: hypothetical protein R2911_04570 [Caldilineaceae bacterium]
MQWLFAVTVVSYLFVFFAGSATIIRMLNLASKALTFVRAGGLGANPDAAMGQIGTAPQIITLEGTYIFLWLVWVVSLVVALESLRNAQTRGHRTRMPSCGAWPVAFCCSGVCCR